MLWNLCRPAKDKTTPLYISMVRGCLRCAVLLLDAGASPDDEASLNNWSPLHAAAATGFVEGVQLLLDRGADKNVQDNLTRRWAVCIYDCDKCALIVERCKSSISLLLVYAFARMR